MASLVGNCSSLSLVAFVFLLCFILVAPINSITVESMKRENKDNGNGLSLNNYNNAPGNLFASRRGYGIGSKMLQISRSKLPVEFDLLLENDEGDRSKRFDDYGHMRFGKRGGEEQFDDYGHMRFGRSI